MCEIEDDEGRKDITRIPEADADDYLYVVTKATLSAIPGIGGPAAELFGGAITQSLARRKDLWIQEIAIRLTELEGRYESFSIRDLFEDEEFITILIQASYSAIRNHQRFKLEALGNIVLNAALKINSKEDLKLHFINLVDTLTESHIKVLSYLNDTLAAVKSDPSIAERVYSLGLEDQGLVNADVIFPELTGNLEFFNAILSDLSGARLITAMPCWDCLFFGERNRCSTSDFGRQFVGFISSPIEL